MKKCKCAGGRPKCDAGKKAWYQKMLAAKAAKKTMNPDIIAKKTMNPDMKIVKKRAN